MEEKHDHDIRTDKYVNNDMKNVADDNRNIVKNVLNLMMRDTDKLEHYQNARKKLPKESDGMYILLEGEVSVVNKFDGHKF
jgi:hypothetical protein